MAKGFPWRGIAGAEKFFARKALGFCPLALEGSARQAMGSFSLPVQADVLRGLRQPLNNPGARQPSLFLRHSLRPDGPAGCAFLAGQPSSARHPCRSALASILSSALRMPPANPRLYDL